MNNKILIELIVPILETHYDVFIPVNKKVGSVTILLAKTISELSGGYYQENDRNCLYNGTTGEIYLANQLIKDTNIRNGSKIIIM